MHYRTIGRALIEFEQSARGEDDFRNFQVATVFVPVEVLEGYLEDLLDPQKGEETLFIQQENSFFGSLQFLMLGLIAAFSLGLFIFSTGISILVSLIAATTAALPFVVVWQFIPTRGAVRRLRLARVLSKLISKRRGRDDEDGESSLVTGSRSILARLVPSSSSESSPGAAFTIH